MSKKKMATNFSGAWVTETVDGSGAGNNVGMFNSLDLDSLEVPHISYFDDANKDLKYAHQ